MTDTAEQVKGIAITDPSVAERVHERMITALALLTVAQQQVAGLVIERGHYENAEMVDMLEQVRAQVAQTVEIMADWYQHDETLDIFGAACMGTDAMLRFVRQAEELQRECNDAGNISGVICYVETPEYRQAHDVRDRVIF